MERIFAHGRIHTFDPARPLVEAVATRAGEVVAAGTLDEARRACPRAEEVDLGGATVLPGLVDAHGHLSLLAERMAALDLSGLASPQAIASAVAGACQAKGAGEWVLGSGWDQNRFDPPVLPDRALLDAAAPARPVLLERVDGHAAWVNTAALRLAGLESAADPPGGRLVRRTDGSPSGIVLDAAFEAVRAAIPPPPREAQQSRLLAAAQHCASRGLTAVHEAGLDLDAFELLEALAAAGRLPLRVYAMARLGDPRFPEVLARGPRPADALGWLSLRCVKAYVDGALGSAGAAMFEPYQDEPGSRGLVTAPPDLEGQLGRALERGFQVALHAIGDRANALCLDLFERLAARGLLRQARPRIEHAQVVRREDIPRFGALGVVASMQPLHAVSDMPWVARRIGRARLAGAYAWRSLRAAGATLAFGSDFPVEDPNPLRGIHAACTRQDAQRRPPGGSLPGERLTRREAIEAYTLGAAFAAFDEERAGRIAPGRRADLSAFDGDVLRAEPGELLERRAVMTVVAGRIAFDGR